MKFIKTNPDTVLLGGLADAGAGFTAGAAIVLVGSGAVVRRRANRYSPRGSRPPLQITVRENRGRTGVGSSKVSALPLVSARLYRASASVGLPGCFLPLDATGAAPKLDPSIEGIALRSQTYVVASFDNLESGPPREAGEAC